MTYADIISDICKHRFTNLTRLERDCGFSQGTIRRWDKINPGIDKLIKVADVLRVPLDMIVGRISTDEELEQKDDRLVENFIEEMRSKNELTDDEQLLLDMFRSMTDEQKNTMIKEAMRIKLK